MRSHRHCLLLFLLLSLAALAQETPAFKVTYPFQFIAYGDIRFTDPARKDWSDPDYRRAIVAQVAKEKPSFLVLTGDLVRRGSAAADWQVWDQETAPWRQAGIHVLPVLGNHDTAGAPDARQYFQRFPELKNLHWYTIRAGNCYFIMLESDVNTPNSAQERWLLRQLRKLPRGVQYLFIVQHHPMVTRSSDRMKGGGHSLRPVDGRLALLLEDRQKMLKIPIIVLSGHVHNYERYVHGGVTYITAGGGGATPYEIPREPADPYQQPGPNYSYCRITVDRKSLNFQMIKVTITDGQPSFTVADSFQLGQAQAGAAR
jgi:Icc-related predicted phosphoesterase